MSLAPPFKWPPVLRSKGIIHKPESGKKKKIPKVLTPKNSKVLADYIRDLDSSPRGSIYPEKKYAIMRDIDKEVRPSSRAIFSGFPEFKKGSIKEHKRLKQMAEKTPEMLDIVPIIESVFAGVPYHRMERDDFVHYYLLEDKRYPNLSMARFTTLDFKWRRKKAKNSTLISNSSGNKVYASNQLISTEKMTFYIAFDMLPSGKREYTGNNILIPTNTLDGRIPGEVRDYRGHMFLVSWFQANSRMTYHSAYRTESGLEKGLVSVLEKYGGGK